MAVDCNCGGANDFCCMSEEGDDIIAQTITLLSDTKENTAREKTLRKHRKYNMSYKGRLRYKRYEWKRNKRNLEDRIMGKQIHIKLLERELEICRERNLQ